MRRQIIGKNLQGTYLPFLVVIVLFVGVWAFWNVSAGNAYAQGNITVADLTVCAEEGIVDDTAACLAFLIESGKKDQSSFILGTDKIFQDLFTWFTSLGGSE